MVRSTIGLTVTEGKTNKCNLLIILLLFYTMNPLHVTPSESLEPTRYVYLFR